MNLAMGSKTVNVASYVLIGRILTFLFTGTALVIVTRLLGPSQYGTYTLAIAFGGMFGSIGYFGIGTALNKFVSEYKQASKRDEMGMIISNSMVLLLISGVVLSAICIVFSSIISQFVFHTGSLSYVIDLVAFYIIASMLFGSFYDTMIGFGNGKHIALMAAVEAVVQASVSIPLALGGLGALAPIIGLIIGYSAGFIIGISLIFKYNDIVLGRISVSYMKKILGFAAPIASYNVFANLTSNIAIIFLGYFAISSVIGNVGVASRAGSLVSVIFDSIGFALLPAFSAALADKKLKKHLGRIYGYTVYLAMAFVGPLLFYMGIFSDPFSALVFGKSYTYAPFYISILCLGLLVGIAGTYAGTLLISANKVRKVFKYNIIVNSIIFALVISLVPYFGSTAYVLLTFILSPLLLDIFLIRSVAGMFKINFRIRKMTGLILADAFVSILALPLYYFLNGAALLFTAAVIFAAIYPLAAVIAGGIEKADTETMISLSKGIPLAGSALRAFIRYAEKVM